MRQLWTTGDLREAIAITTVIVAAAPLLARSGPALGGAADR